MGRSGARGTSRHQGNHLADMSLPPEQRGRRRTVRTSRKPVPAQLQHGSSPAGRRKAREGERLMERQRRDDSWG